MREVAQASSILSLVGEGCHRLSEIAARIGKPATSLTRPMARLMDIGLVDRMVPFGAHLRATKRSLYRMADPFLLFWFRFVAPNRSSLHARQFTTVERMVKEAFPHHVGTVWEDLGRSKAATDGFAHTRPAVYVGRAQHRCQPSTGWLHNM